MSTQIPEPIRHVSGPAFPSIATLIAEDHAAEGGALWCCPLCGGLNAADDPLEPFAAEGWCQHDKCADRRAILRSLPWVNVTPEIGRQTRCITVQA